MSNRIQTYAEFWPFYLREHSSPWTRRIHVLGTTVAVVVAIHAVATGDLGRLWLPFVIGYGFAWPSHLLIEKNRPATFKYPAWSFVSDFKMAYLFWMRRLDPELAKAGVKPSDRKAA